MFLVLLLPSALDAALNARAEWLVADVFSMFLLLVKEELARQRSRGCLTVYGLEQAQQQHS
jgi:hypothetical protein